MVKINKSRAVVPAILASGGAGEVETQLLKNTIDNGRLNFKIKPEIYGDKEVKKTLKKIQSNKCCFCESRVPHIAHGDIEHFRPKKGVKIEGERRIRKPGYYWLAYDFSNLFYCCQICNQQHKKNYFPLLDETKRAKSHHDDYRLEENLILNPSSDDPTKHLYFDREFIKPKDSSLKGQQTIKHTGLNRPDLVKERREYLEVLERLALVAKQGDRDAMKFFKEKGKSSAMFSLMIRCNFPDLV